MIQAKIKKGDLIKTKSDIWGSYWSHYGHVNFEIKKDMLFIAIADQVYIPEMSAAEVDCFIDNKIVTIVLRDNEKLQII